MTGSSSAHATYFMDSFVQPSLQMTTHLLKSAGFWAQLAWNLELALSRLTTIERFFLILLTKNSNRVLHSY